MKHEMAHAFSALIVAGTGSLLDRIPTTYKAIVVLGVVFAAGMVADRWYTEQLELPSRVTALEADVLSLRSQDDTAARERDEIIQRLDTQNLLTLRVLCRLDGNTANSCDLAYGGGRRLEVP